jgi:rhodanese-related sulfurtransferase
MSQSNMIEDVPPVEAWAALSANKDAVLIDVRTDIEWDRVGMPALPAENGNLHFISWQVAPDMRINPGFLSEMAAAGVRKNVPVYFLCRSGVRSRAAAEEAAAAGYGPCYNVAEGFEGIAGPDGVRHGGWRGNGLPETKTSNNT